MRHSYWFVLFSLSLGCIPTDFDDLREEAPTVAFTPPEAYSIGGFGTLAVGYGFERDGVFQARVAASAGSNSPYISFPFLSDSELDFGAPVLEGCDEASPCGTEAGISAAGLYAWGGREGCLAIPIPGTGTIRIVCEDDTSNITSVTGPDAARLGASAAGVREDHPLARAVFGAPNAFGGRGAIYRLPDNQNPLELDSSEAAGRGSNLGGSIAVAPLTDEDLLIAAGALGGSVKRVSVLSARPPEGGTQTVRARACLDNEEENWGEALALGDLDGDGNNELVVGYLEAEGNRQAIRVYPGNRLPSEGQCDEWPDSQLLTCPTEVESVSGLSVDCESAGFGTSLSIADVNADGIDDLIVGAPRARVGEVGGAGAVFVFAGGEEFDDFGDQVAVLVHSEPQTGANLGSTVSAVPGRLTPRDGGDIRRFEVVAGAPGEDRLYVFLCSSIESEQGIDRCQP